MSSAGVSTGKRRGRGDDTIGYWEGWRDGEVWKKGMEG